MKRIWRISEAAQADLFFTRGWKPRKTLNPFAIEAIPPTLSFFTRTNLTQAHSPSSSGNHAWSNVISLFENKLGYLDDTAAKRVLVENVSELRDELVVHGGDVENVERVLREKGVPLFKKYSDGSAVVELLKQLDAPPHLAIEVFDWRRRQMDPSTPMVAEEYVKAISVAGRLRNVDLAVELFREAVNKNLKTTSLYNALLTVYMINGLAVNCQSLFRDLKREPTCSPSIVTYNILISVFGRLMLIDHMEETFREIMDLGLSPNVNTYNSLIAGYVTAWMWDKQEKTYQVMAAGPVKPDQATHLLMLRGYAHSGKLEKMEATYELVKDHVNHKEIPLVRAMICAYIRSSDKNRVKKVEELLKLIPENEYRPWLNVLLICLYAQEDLFERMESFIDQAFKHKTSVITVAVMRCIIAGYFRHKDVDKLASFVKRAESAGWKICRSLYHCKMVMYGSQRRLDDMEQVLDEMGKLNIDLSKRTFWILFKAYSTWGEKNKLQQVLGMLCKHGCVFESVPAVHIAA